MSVLSRAYTSIQTRFIIPYQQTHFDRTGFGKQVAAYKNQYDGRRCFFIGNGPSLRAEDLTKLQENGEVTFAFNRIYNIFDQNGVRRFIYLKMRRCFQDA